MARVPGPQDFIGRRADNLRQPSNVRFSRDPQATARRLGAAFEIGGQALGQVADDLRKRRQGAEDARLENFFTRRLQPELQTAWNEMEGLASDPNVNFLQEFDTRAVEVFENLQKEAEEQGYGSGSEETRLRLQAKMADQRRAFGIKSVTAEHKAQVQAATNEYSLLKAELGVRVFNDFSSFEDTLADLEGAANGMRSAGILQDLATEKSVAGSTLAEQALDGLIDRNPTEALKVLNQEDHPATRLLNSKQLGILIGKARSDSKSSKNSNQRSVKSLVESAVDVASKGGDPSTVVTDLMIDTEFSPEVAAIEKQKIRNAQRQWSDQQKIKSNTPTQNQEMLFDAVKEFQNAQNAEVPPVAVELPKTVQGAKSTLLKIVSNPANVSAEEYSPTLNSPEYKNYLETLEDQYGLPRGDLFTLMQVEHSKRPKDASGRSTVSTEFIHNARSPADGQGPFQIIPKTAKALGEQMGLGRAVDPFNIVEAAEAAAFLRNQLFTRYNGNKQLADAQYNASIAAVEAFQAGRRDLPSETKEWMRLKAQAERGYTPAGDFTVAPAGEDKASVYTIPTEDGNYANIPATVNGERITEEEAKQLLDAGEIEAIETFGSLDDAVLASGVMNKLFAQSAAQQRVDTLFKAIQEEQKALIQDPAKFILSNVNSFPTLSAAVEAKVSLQIELNEAETEEDRQRITQEIQAAQGNIDKEVINAAVHKGVHPANVTLESKEVAQGFVDSFNTTAPDQRPIMLQQKLAGRPKEAQKLLLKQYVEAGLPEGYVAFSSVEPWQYQQVAEVVEIDKTELTKTMDSSLVTQTSDAVKMAVQELQQTFLAGGSLVNGTKSFNRYVGVVEKAALNGVKKGKSVEDAVDDAYNMIFGKYETLNSGSENGKQIALYFSKDIPLEKSAVQQVFDRITSDEFDLSTLVPIEGPDAAAIADPELREEFSRSRTEEAFKNNVIAVHNGKTGPKAGMRLMYKLRAGGTIPVSVRKGDEIKTLDITFAQMTSPTFLRSLGVKSSLTPTTISDPTTAGDVIGGAVQTLFDSLSLPEGRPTISEELQPLTEPRRAQKESPRKLPITDVLEN